MTKHPHAENMLEYAYDALETDVVWKRWQFWDGSNKEWRDCIANPPWGTMVHYRHKPEYEQQLRVDDIPMEYMRGAMSLFKQQEQQDMTEQEFTIGSQWMTQGGWHAVIVRSEKDGLLVWHNFPEKVVLHDEEGTAKVADPDYNIARPWVPADEIETIEIGGIEVPRPEAQGVFGHGVYRAEFKSENAAKRLQYALIVASGGDPNFELPSLEE